MVRSSPEKSAKLSANLRAAAENGRHPGKLPFGYSYPEQYGDLPVVNEAEARTVREAFRLAAAGRSVSEVAFLLEMGELMGRDGRPLARSSVWAMLTNPYYAGKLRLKGREYPGIHQPLIPWERYEAAKQGFFQRREVSTEQKIAPRK